ncbi:MAG: elongation factor P [Candidatus Improbicoccus devescovinae]|nr:MAG: elongation factor P [Candidatus Improbicoccus devescovinae]
MISAGDFRNGTTFELDSQLVTIVEFQHVKPGKGSAFVRVKLKNINTGSIIERTFNPNEKYQEAFIDRKIMQYLYTDGNIYYFMDNKTYEQIPVNKNVLGGNFKFVKENTECKVLIYKDTVLGIEPPVFVELKIISTEPGVRGDTATNVNKPAKLETEAEIRVPIFVNEGDVIKIDTRTGEYVERV